MKRLGLFAEVLHMTPRDVDRLTVGEFDYMCKWLDAREKQAKEASRRG